MRKTARWPADDERVKKSSLSSLSSSFSKIFGVDAGVIMVKALLQILGTALIYIVLAMEVQVAQFLNAKQQPQ